LADANQAQFALSDKRAARQPRTIQMVFGLSGAASLWSRIAHNLSDIQVNVALLYNFGLLYRPSAVLKPTLKSSPGHLDWTFSQ